MIDNKCKIGYELWRIHEKTNIMRDKLRFTDADGNEWSRYPKPIREYSIEKVKIIGLSITDVYGDVPFALQHQVVNETVYVIEDSNNSHDTIETYEYDDYFYTEDAALEHVVELKLKDAPLN